MTSLDVRLRAVMAENGARTTLFTVNTRFIHRFLIGLLRVLVNEEKKQGVYVCIDRPGAFVQATLRKCGIDVSQIMFVDAVVKVASDLRAERAPVQILSTPFCTEIVKQLTEVMEKINARLDAPPPDFLMVDNLGVLSCYCDDKTIERLMEALEVVGPRKSYFTIDPSTNEGLYRLARDRVQKSVELPADLFKLPAATA